ncbi:hypothetical protein ACKFKG_03175 [Phormidesmis sp. 146-35]
MAIKLFEDLPVLMSEEKRTWCCSILSPLGEEPRTEVYREKVRRLSTGEVTTYQDSSPIVVRPAEMGGLAKFAEIPPEYAHLIPDKATLGKFLALLPLLVSIACDAAERKKNENHP